MAILTAPTRAFAPRTHRLHPKAAAAAYVGAWALGLALTTGPAAGASDAEMAQYFADHRALTALQSLLVHGVAAGALYTVLAAVQRTSGRSRMAWTAAVVGVGLSVTQLGLGLWRSLFASGSAAVDLAHAVNRVDGLKMFAFAVMIGAGTTAMRAAGMMGRRMTLTGRAAVAALVVSGTAYGLDIEGLLNTAAVSLVLLLTWVAYAGVAAGRRAA